MGFPPEIEKNSFTGSEIDETPAQLPLFPLYFFLADSTEFVKVWQISWKEKKMKALGIYGSPRRGGNTELLLREMLRGCRDAEIAVEEIFLRDLKISPCLEIYACRKNGQCPIRDDMRPLYAQLVDTDVLILASPIFFYSVSAHAKAFIDRCQAFWAKKYLLNQPVAPGRGKGRAFSCRWEGPKGKRSSTAL